MDEKLLKKELEEAEEKVNQIRAGAKVLFDGRQFMIKIPREIERYYKLKKNKFIFEFRVDISKPKDEFHLFRIKGASK